MSRYFRSTRARQTNYWVTTGHADDLGLDRGLSDYDGIEHTRWYNYCEAHGSIVGHQTLALAKAFAAAPKDWCEHCAAGEPPDPELVNPECRYADEECFGEVRDGVCFRHRDEPTPIEFIGGEAGDRIQEQLQGNLYGRNVL
jgi:hypothetical protein